MAMPVANGLLENPPGISERLKLICLSLTSVTGSSLSKVHLLYCLSSGRGNGKMWGRIQGRMNSCPAWELPSFELW